MVRTTLIFAFIIGFTFNCLAQQAPLKTLGITDGSVHMKGSVPYTKFLKKHKGEQSELVIHVYYNATGSTVNPKDIKAGDNEVYFMYARNSKTGLSEMTFKFGTAANKAFSKKKEAELTEFIDFFEFEVFPNQNFNGALAMEAVETALE